MNKEFIYIASNSNVKMVHIGIFPSYGRYYRRQMTHCGGSIFRTEIDLPRGEVYFHYFVNEDFSHPHSNILEEMVAKDDPLKRSSFFIGTKPFCALEFDTNSRFVSRDRQGNITFRVITHHTHIESLALITGNENEIPFIPLLRFRNQTFWLLKLPAADTNNTFALKLGINGKEIIHHKHTFTDLKDIKVEVNQRIVSPYSVGYQVFPDRFFKSRNQKELDYFLPWGEQPTFFSFFGGDIAGIIEKLPYLNQLGIDFIYLNPVFYSGTPHRYDTIDYYRVDPVLGKNSDFKNLVEKAHALNISIILDISLNHSGVDFFAFKDILENQESSKYCSWFCIRSFPVQVSEKPNYDSYRGFPHMPEFNLENPDVTEYLINAVLYWLIEYDVDGFRIDICASLPLDFIRELVRRIRDIKPGALIIGEYWHSNAIDILEYTGADSITNYSIYWEAIRPLFEKGASSIGKAVTGIMDWYYRYALQYTKYSWNFLGNHDLPRLYSIMQDKRWYKMAIALLYALPGTPVIYYGEEIPLEGMNDPDNRQCMEWSESALDNSNFQSLSAFYRMLNCLRKKHATVFEDGSLSIPYLDETQKTLVLQRFTDEEVICFIFNFREEKSTINLSQVASDYKFPGIWLAHNRLLEMESNLSLNPYEVKILNWSRNEMS